jgi:hypothetical protein
MVGRGRQGQRHSYDYCSRLPYDPNPRIEARGVDITVAYDFVRAYKEYGSEGRFIESIKRAIENACLSDSPTERANFLTCLRLVLPIWIEATVTFVDVSVERVVLN